MSTPQILIVSGLAIVISMLLLSRSLRGRRKTENRLDQVNEFRQRTEVRDGLDKLAVEIQELSRESIARLDTKIKILQALLTEADVRIARLQGAPPPPPTPKGAALPVQKKVFDLADRGASVADIGRETGLERGEVELILGMRGLPPDSKV